MIKNSIETVKYLKQLYENGGFDKDVTMENNLSLLGVDLLKIVPEFNAGYVNGKLNSLENPISDFTHILSSMTDNIGDVMRPNLFKVSIEGIDEENEDQKIIAPITSLIKSFNVPPVQKSIIKFFRMGKPISKPVEGQNKMVENINVKFYNDVMATNIKSCFALFNELYDFKAEGLNLVFTYDLSGYLQGFPEDNTSSFLGTLIADGISYGADYAKELADQKAGFPISNLTKLLYDYRSNLDNTEILEKENITPRKDFALKITFYNIYLASTSFGNFDMERSDMYSESDVVFGYNGVDVKFNDDKVIFDQNS